MAECEKVCRYIDLPLQHASADGPEAHAAPGQPRRRYDALLGRIRDAVPGVTLRTTFIVGFPGETEAEFAELRGVRRRHRLRPRRRVHVLARGRHARLRPGRRRAGRGRSAARATRLMAAAEARSSPARSRRGSASGSQVLVDGPSPEHELVLQGRLEGQAPDIDPVVYPDRLRSDA